MDKILFSLHQDMPDLEDVDVSEQLEDTPATRLNIVDVTEEPESEPEEIPLLKPKHLQEQDGIFSSKSII